LTRRNLGYSALCSAPSGDPDYASPDQDVSDGIHSSNRDEPYTNPADIVSGWPGNPDRHGSSPFAMPPSWRADKPVSHSTGDASAADRE